MIKKQTLLIIPSLFIAIAIFLLSHQEKVPFIELGFDFSDKLLHVAAYFVFGITILVALIANFKLSDIWVCIISVFIGSVYAASDEFHQSMIKGRNSSIYDWFADLIGLFLALLFIKTIKRVLRKSVTDSEIAK